MGARQKDWARRARAKLVAQLGGKCVMCASTEDLQFDHIVSHSWVASHTEWSHRISIYRREAKAGLIQLLCAYHNRVKGRPPEPDDPF